MSELQEIAMVSETALLPGPEIVSPKCPTEAGNRSRPGPSSGRELAVSIGRNTLFGMIARVAQVGSRLITIPIVIAHLGLGGYGIWSIIMTIAAYTRFGVAGVKSAFQKYVAEATGNGDFETASKLLSTGCAGLIILSTISIPIALFAGALARAAGVPPEFLAAAAKSIAMLALIIALSNIAGVYEAIIMGGHRIDLVRNLTTFCTVAEAIAIVICLHLGYGLFAMAIVMSASELGYFLCCYIIAKRIVPEVRISRVFVTGSVVGELVRFAGSYQLVNILEVLYASILPITILRAFGANASGVYALATRVVSSALMLWEPFLLPILSGGAMVYASGSQEEMQRLIHKSFKLTLGICLFPLAFIAVFGPTMIFAWTGQSDVSLPVVLHFVCLAGLFGVFAALGMVLYRASGHALFDNVRQMLRIVVLLSILVFARKISLYEVLAGLAIAECIGSTVMILAVARTFHRFHPKDLLPDSLRLVAATTCVLAAGIGALLLPSPNISSARLSAIFLLGKAALACLMAVWPALRLTKSLTGPEMRLLLHVVLPQRLFNGVQA
jgi:O-antigen/teichoic acid export membrane protein